MAFSLKRETSPMGVTVNCSQCAHSLEANGGAARRRPRPLLWCGGATSFWKRGSSRSGSNIESSRNNAGLSGQLIHAWAPLFFKQEFAHFSNDQRFIYYEHVVVRVMQFDDSRVLDARAEALDCAFYPLRERLDVAIDHPSLLCTLHNGLVEAPW